MKVYQVYKIDREYIVLAENAPVPAVGERSYHRSARAALEFERMAAESYGARGRDVTITPNEHASRDLILSCGLSAA